MSIAPQKTLSHSEQTLQALLQQAKVPSQRSLAAKANVSRWQVQQLRQGHLETMRVSVLKQLAAALDCSLLELLKAFEPAATTSPTEKTDAEKTVGTNATQLDEVTQLRQEYSRLQTRLDQQTQELQHQFQTEALRVLESWLTYWPTATKAATERDGFDAKKLLPLVKPVERLVAGWGVTPTGAVGDQLAYDPQHHQLVRGAASPGDPVRITHVGYHHQGALLQRTKVVPFD
ncbi:MAG: helix-turn-helix domain-containing protein [Leptolyngbyaceae cyanobacterium]